MKSLIRKILREARWRPHFQEDIQNIAGQILQDIMNNSFQFTHEVDDEIDDEDYDEDDYYVDDSCENPYVTFAISVDGSSCKKYDDLCLSVKVCVVEIDEEFPFDVEAGNEDTDIDISIKLSPHFSKKDYHQLYASIRENLRHEVEHAMQNLNPNKEQFQDFNTKYEEFNARHEVPAYVRGFWDKAKILGEPLSGVMRDFLDDMVTDGMISKTEAQSTHDNWMDYARKNIGSLKESSET